MAIKVTGTSGKAIQIQVLGIGEVMRRLRQANLRVKDSADLGVVQAGAFVEEEVKESIGGHRAEHQSVESGLFCNSIQFFKTGYATGIVKSDPRRYPKGNKTTEDIAKLMEFSPRIAGGPRRHFQNTLSRTRGRIRQIIAEEIRRNQKFGSF